MSKSMEKCMLTVLMTLAYVQMSAQFIFTENKDVAADDHSSVAFYQQFSYEWTDDDGETHTSCITDEATDPNQMFELLKWVYADKRIPGTKWVYSDLDPESIYTVPYPNGTNSGSDILTSWGIDEFDSTGSDEDNPYGIPNEHGTTLLVINLKDDFDGYSTPSATVEKNKLLIKETMKSVRLVTGMTRVDSETNPGYIFNCKGEYNKFYLVAKGRARDGGRDAPFRGMYEELSPGNKSPQYDVYDVLFNGEVQNVYHDCASVICQSGGGHYLSLGTLYETANYDLNMCLFIPDYRLVYWTMSDILEEMPDFVHPSPPGNGSGGRDTNGDYTWYNPKYLPKLFLHTVVLDTATATRTDEMTEEDALARNYAIHLDWTSRYGDIDFEIDETYTVYKIVNGDVTLVAEGLTEPVYDYYEPQHTTGYEIMYYVTAQPIGMDGYTPVESNVRSVVIPGYDPLESLRLDIDGDYSSEYFYQGAEENYYVNTIVAKNSYVVDYVAGFHLEEGTVMTFYRMLDEAGAGSTAVASVTIGEVVTVNNDDDTWTRTFAFTIDYASGEVPEGAVMKGTLSCTADTEEGLDAAKVEFDDKLMVVDKFSASTATNDQPDRYYYQLTYTAAKEIADGSKEAHSNIVSVPVFKTTYTVDGWVYSADQIKADTAGVLAVSDEMYITFQAQNHPEIRDYTVYRNDEIVAIAQRTQEGSYSVITYHNGYATGAAQSASAGLITVVDDVSDVDGTVDELHARYVIVITTFSRNFATNGGKTNTYGSVRVDEPLVDVAFTSLNPIYNNHNHDGKFHYVTIKYWEAYLYEYGEGDPNQLRVNVDDMPHYGLWRSIDGGEEELVAFSNEAYNTFVVNDDKNLDVSSNDSFFYAPIDDIDPTDKTEGVEGKDFEVTYRLRVYAYDESGQFRIAETTAVVPYKHGEVVTETVETNIDEHEMRIYPNPADTQVTVEADGDIAIYNLMGRQVMNVSDGEQSRVIDVSHLPAGIYIVKSKEARAKLQVK